MVDEVVVGILEEREGVCMWDLVGDGIPSVTILKVF